jgi:hypothetical protein
MALTLDSTFVIPGRRDAASPEPITPACDYGVKLSPAKYANFDHESTLEKRKSVNCPQGKFPSPNRIGEFFRGEFP